MSDDREWTLVRLPGQQWTVVPNHEWAEFEHGCERVRVVAKGATKGKNDETPAVARVPRPEGELRDWRL